MNWLLTRKIINWFFVIIALGVALALVGQSDSEGAPLPTEYGKSGVAAAVELAKKLGYKVSIESNLLPNYPPGALAVVVYEVGQSSVKKIDQMVSGKDLTVLQFPYSQRFPPKGTTLNTVTNSLTNEKFTVNFSKVTAGLSQISRSGYLATPFLSDNQNLEFATLFTDKRVKVISFDSSQFLYNEYIDKSDNAALFASLLNSYAGKSKTVVFNTAFYDSSKNSLIASLGPWAEGIWLQAWVVLIALIFTANSRFGLPVVLRAKQAGQRQLVDGLNSILIRRKDTVEMAAAVKSRVHEIVAKKNRMSKSRVAENEKRYLSAEVMESLARLERVPIKHFAAEAQKILRQLEL